MVRVFASSVVDRRFEHPSGHTMDYKIDIYCFSANHAAGNNCQLGIRTMCPSGATCVLRTVVSVHTHYKNPTKPVVLLQIGHHHHHLI